MEGVHNLMVLMEKGDICKTANLANITVEMCE